MTESPIAEVTRILREKGVIDRMAETSINENHLWLVSVGELPELVRGELHQHLVPAPDTTGSNVAGISARQTPAFVPEIDGVQSTGANELGSFGVLSGTLTVTGPADDVETLADEHVTEVEPTAKKGRKKAN